uniref:Nucleoside diphosphate kinase n=1 Tax=uncultured marine group II/III euryarchaeote KM3_139_C07 TaxID=1457870 RepID=A0A075GBS1_9EURY|nr:nucleoside diphosphate kinase (ndk) [uncultured marine group II/III euryarchaeote KM3_139_C07]
MMEKTLVLLKPDAVQRSLIGEIISRFEKVGMKVIGMKMVWVDKSFAKKHYKAHVEKKFYSGLEAMITEGPVIAMVIEGLHVIEAVRKMVGGTEPKTAQPGTIRGDYAHHSYEYTDKKGTAIKNLIHASGDKKDAGYEIKLWFKEKELHSYKTVQELHTF